MLGSCGSDAHAKKIQRFLLLEKKIELFIELQKSLFKSFAELGSVEEHFQEESFSKQLR